MREQVERDRCSTDREPRQKEVELFQMPMLRAYENLRSWNVSRQTQASNLRSTQCRGRKQRGTIPVKMTKVKMNPHSSSSSHALN